MKALLDGLKALGTARLAAMAAVGAGMLGLLALLMLRGPTERMALLYAELDPREAGQMAELLDRQRVPHQLGAGGAQILVPADQVARARLLLAKDGLPTGGSIGYELFDRSDNLTSSQFQQNLNQARALEGELARTIRSLSGVRAARVHLVLPRREPFARDRQDAQASVVLTMVGTARMDHEGVQAILNLVSSAVPGLRAQNVAVIDNRGNVLARAGAPVAAAAAQNAEELRRGIEMRIARAVEDMLDRGLGPGRSRAEASIEMDFDQVHETQERFDPDGQVVRSSQTVNGNSRSTEAASNVSVQNNLPNADAGREGAGSQEQKQEETTNYEIGKTVRTLVREQPQLRRVSLAVLVDGAEERAPDGTVLWRARTPEELERIDRLVRSAIGFDERRGDHVEVVNMRFFSDPAGAADAQGLLGLPLERADLMRLAQTGVLAIVALAALLLVLRPMALRITAAADASALAGPDAAAAVLAGGRGMGAPALPGGTSAAMLAGAEAATVPLLQDESMVRLANIDGQMRASSLRRLAELVDKHPEESLMILRAWMQQENA
ncbi:Flagellar M-ring protein [Rhodovastum atsumiense]|uniref:Flagellar M-ring protein n=1 Tax=Rhodovastum atsumiense TaxID=504468 RepID=A0A5M6IW74_9PROT|nr:flagellar basal-body MS-ring/collar protein FliF [Rhodovastum atsumiense]KAA5612471.1 flagellar M-ring protein FliF [Rhodovastum atsumiense]CAH2600385.1 Flagellar M-ring protein [Rhodovastum atsumiense]